MARKRDHLLVATRRTDDATKTPVEPPAVQIALELADDEARQPVAVATSLPRLSEKRGEPMSEALIERIQPKKD